jgi:hypothetical protein
LEVTNKFLGGKDRPAVRYIFKGDNAKVAAHEFEGFQGTQGLMCVEVHLVFNVNETGGVVNKDASSSVHVGGVCAASGVKSDPFGRADEVIHRDALAGKQLVFLEDWRGLVGDGVPGAAMCLGRSCCLFTKLAGSALGPSVTTKFGGSKVKGPSRGRQAEDAGAHEKLDLGVVEVSETLVPAKELLGRFIQVQVARVHSLGQCVEGLGSFVNFRETISSGDRDVVLGAHKGLNRCAFTIRWNSRECATLFGQLNLLSWVLLEKAGSPKKFDWTGRYVVSWENESAHFPIGVQETPLDLSHSPDVKTCS